MPSENNQVTYVNRNRKTFSENALPMFVKEYYDRLETAPIAALEELKQLEEKTKNIFK